MSNASRSARRRREREVAKGLRAPPPGAANNSAGPMMSVYEDKGSVVIHIAYQDAWINVVRMSADDAESHARELLDLVKQMRGGIVAAKGPSGLITPQLTEGGLHLP